MTELEYIYYKITNSMSRDLRNDIIKHLKKKGDYDPDVDDYLIDMLLENIEYANTMKADIERQGCVIEKTSGNGFRTTKMNPSFGVYQMCLRNIHQAAAKLGISRADRLKLKLVEEKEKDDFDKDFA